MDPMSTQNNKDREIPQCTLSMTYATAVTLLSVVLIAGCGRISTQEPATRLPLPVNASEPLAMVAAAPVRIVCIPDETGSTDHTRVRRINGNSLGPLIHLVTSHGGELGVTVVRDRRDNTSMIRLRIDLKPVRPPIKPLRDKNPFQINMDEAKFRMSEQSYHERLKARDSEIEGRVAAFKKELEPILARPANAERSAVCDAFRRANLFLNEPADGWWAQPHMYVLAITDGIDTYGERHCQPLNSGAPVLLVNGSGSMGSLNTLHPLRFEGVSAAVDYIVSKEEH